MAGNYDELQAVLRELLTNRFAPKPEYTRGLLGDGQGNVTVPGRPDKNYVRFNRGSTEFFQIFNVTVPAVNNWPVLIGELPWLPGLTQVVGTDWASYEQSGWNDNLGATSPHAPTHEWPDGSPGADPLNIYLRSIVPLRAYSLGTGSTTIYVNSYEYTNIQFSGTVWSGLPGIDLQPVMNNLSTGTALLMGVYLDPAINQLGIVTGASDIFTDASDPPSPQFPQSVIPVARVRVYGGQASIGEVDIRDARQPFGWIPTGTASVASGGWPFNAANGANDVITVHPTDTDADYSDLATAINNAATNSTILFAGRHSISGSKLTINKVLTIIGFSPESSEITSTLNGDTVDITAAATVRNCKISNDGGNTNGYAARWSSAGILFDNVVLESTGANSNNNYGLYVDGSGGAGRLKNVRTTVSGASGNMRSVYIESITGQNVIIEGGHFDKGIEAVEDPSSDGGELELINPQFGDDFLSVDSKVVLSGSAIDSQGRDAGIVVQNVSGAAANKYDIGYLDTNGDYDTTTTEADVVEWHVVTIGGSSNNGFVFVKNRGLATVNYTGSAPSDGDFLTTSTTAGSATARSTMHYAIFAQCLAAGSGGTVEVILLTQRQVKTPDIANDVWAEGGTHSDLDFVSTISSLPGGADLVYGSVTSGNENNLVPASTSQISKMVLHNTTQGEEALISDCDTSTNTITLTANVPGTWATSDSITIRSQTNTSTASDSYFADMEFTSDIVGLETAFLVYGFLRDTGGSARLVLHPYQSNVNSKRKGIRSPSSNILGEGNIGFVPLIDNKFMMAIAASGTDTINSLTYRIAAVIVAAP